MVEFYNKIVSEFNSRGCWWFWWFNCTKYISNL